MQKKERWKTEQINTFLVKLIVLHLNYTGLLNIHMKTESWKKMRKIIHKYVGKKKQPQYAF